MISLNLGNALNYYNTWEKPVVIVSDGPYGLDSYDGDLKTTNGLADWYRPHVQAWSDLSSPLTTLWFWNSELGWAEVHPLLRELGWVYRSCCIWDKGIAHAAGNSNTKTLRKFPVVSEVCVHYIRKSKFILNKGEVSAQEWLRQEWLRTGLPLCESNKACGVKNAATRKYLTTDHVWYFPPPEVFGQLANYANENGKPEGRPYFSLDGKNILKSTQWEQMRGKFHCEAGITNVWNVPAVRGKERIKIKNSALHPNQKPLLIMDRIVKCSSDEGDVIWEPFGGLCSASIAADRLGRRAYAAEINKKIFEAAIERIGK